MSNLVLSKSRFVHIPKCAGTFVISVIGYLGLKKHRYDSPHFGHLCLHQMPEEDYFNFAFVRHPYTWWPSYYYYMRKGFDLQEGSSPDFDSWLQDYGPFWLGHYSTIVRRFIGIDPLYTTNNKISFIGKTENLEEDLFKALKAADENFNEVKYKEIFKQQDTEKGVKTQWGNVQSYDREISAESKKLIYTAERWIFDTFEYAP
jgi:hypothetical protein